MKNILNFLLILPIIALAACTTKSDSNTPTATAVPAFLSVTYDESVFVVSGQCSVEHNVNILDVNNNPANATVDQLVRLTANSSTVSFYSDATCKSKVSSIQIKSGSSSGKFYVIDSAVEYFSYTVSTTNIKSDSESHTVVSANAARLSFTGPNSVQAGGCSLPFTLKTLDINGTVSTVSSDTTVNFNGLGIGKIYTTPDCSGVAVNSVTVPAQSNNVQFYFNTTKLGSYNLVAAAPGNVTATLFVSAKAGNPSQIVFLSTPPTVTAGECSSSVTAQYQDAFSNTATLTADSYLTLSGSGLSFFSNSSCSGSPITQSLVTANSSTTTFYFKATSTATSSLSVTGTVGSQIQSITVNAANGTQLVIPQIQNTVTAGGAINNTLINVQALDRFGNVAAGPSRVYSLTAFADSACTIQSTKPFTHNGGAVVGPISSATGSAAFSDVEYTKAEVVYLGASSSGLSSACSTAITVTPSVANSLVLSGPASVKAGQCSASFIINTTDTYKNISPTSSITNLSIAGQGNGNFYQLSDCSGNPINSVAISSGQSSVKFYFKSSTIESLMIAASGFGTNTSSIPATTPLSVTSGSATNLVFTAPINGVAGQCVSGLSVSEQDAFGNSSNVDSDTLINLSTNGSGNFYTDSSCSNNVTFVYINSGTSSRSFYFKDTKAESANLVASGTSSLSKTMNITPALANKLKIAAPASATAGNLISGLSVSVLDSYGNVQTNSASSIGVTAYSDSTCSTEAATQFNGTRTVSAVAGVSNFNNLKYNETAVIYVKATSGTLTSDCSGSLSISSGVPSAFALAADYQTTTAGKCVLLTAVTKDSLGNTAAPNSDLSVSLTSGGSARFYSDATCGTQVSTLTVLKGTSTGKAYFNDTKAETINLLTDASGFTQGTTQVTFLADVPSQLKMTGPFSVVANACSSAYTIAVLDQYNNKATVSSTKSLQLQAGGSANFYADSTCGTGISATAIQENSSSVVVYMKDLTAETISLGVTGVSLTSAAVANVVISPSAITKVTVNTSLVSIGAGVCSGPVNVVLKDSYGNVANTNSDKVISYETNNSILFYENSSCAGLPVSSSTIYSGQSSKSVYVKDSTAETASVNFSSSGLTAATQSFPVVPASPNKIAFVSAPKTITAGSCSGAVEIGLYDSLNNETKATSTVNLSLSSLGVSYYSTADCTGGSINSVQIPTGLMSAVIYAKATLTSTNSLSASSSYGGATQLFTVNPASPVGVLLGQVPATGSPGTPVFSTSVNTYIADGYGNRVSDSTAQVEIDAYADSTCTNPSTTSFTGTTIKNASSGSANFSGLGYTTTGSLYIKAQSVGLTSACSNVINISASAPYKIVVAGPSSGNAAACIGPFVLTSKDSQNNNSNALSNIVVSFSGGAQSKIYSASDCSGSEITSKTIVTGNSSASFYLKDTVSENFTLTGSSTLGSINVPMSISPLSPTFLAVIGPSSIPSKSCSGPFKVTAMDAYSNPSNVPQAENVNFGSLANMKVYSDSACSTTITSSVIVAGTSSNSFYLMDSTVENITLLLTGSSLGSASDSVTVTAPAPSAIAINTTVTSVMAGDCSGPFDINLKDSSGANAATTNSLAVGLSGGNGQFYSTSSCKTPVSAVTVAAGTATKQVWFKDTLAEAVFLTASAQGMSNGLYPVTVNAGAISSLTFVVAPPASTVSSQTISPAINLSYSDQYGNQIYYSDYPINVSLLNEDGTESSGLAGTLSVPTDSSSGIATFNDLKIVKSGRYKIKATGGAYSKISDAFTIQSGPATQISIVSGNNQQMGRQGTSTPLTVLVQDANNNPAMDSVTYTLSGSASLDSGSTIKTLSTNSDATTGNALAYVYSALTEGNVTVNAKLTSSSTVSFSVTVVNYSPLTAVLSANSDPEIETDLAALNIIPSSHPISFGSNILTQSSTIAAASSPQIDSSGYFSQSLSLVSSPLALFNGTDNITFNLSATYPNGISSGTCNYSPSTDLGVVGNPCVVGNPSMTMKRSDIDGNSIIAKVASSASFSSSYDTLNSNAVKTKKLTLTQVSNINPNGSDEPQNFTVFGSTLYFSAQSDSGIRKLFKINESNTITQILDVNTGADDNPHMLTAVGSSYLYFVAKNQNSVDKLYRFNGTTINLVSNLVGDNTVSDSITAITTDGTNLYMNASRSYSSAGGYIYKGFKVTANGIYQFTNLSGASSVSDLFTSMESGANFPFISYGYKSVDGTKSNLYLYDGNNNIKVSSTSGGLNDNANVISTDNGLIYFTANNPQGAKKMFMMVPDSNSNYYTNQVTNILGDSISDGIQFLGSCNQQIYFAGKVDTSTSNYKLFNYDSKTSSVNKLSDNRSGGTDFSPGYEKGTCYGGQFYLPMLDASGNMKLFHHNGVRLSQVSNIKSTGETISGLTVYNNALYFAAEEAGTGNRRIYRLCDSSQGCTP